MMNRAAITLGMVVALGGVLQLSAATYTGDSWYLQLIKPSSSDPPSGSILAPGSFSGKINGTDWKDAGAGALKFTQVDGDTYTPQSGSGSFNETRGFYTYCTDIQAHVNWGAKYEFLPMVFEQANTVFPPPGVNPPWYWENDYKGIYYAAVVYNLMLPGTGWAQDLIDQKTESEGQMHGAAQLAIWEMLYDPNWDLDAGIFTVGATAAGVNNAMTRDLAKAMLNNVKAMVDSGNMPEYDQTWLQPLEKVPNTVNTYKEGTFQGMLYKEGGLRVPDGGWTIGLLGAAVLGISMARRKLGTR